MIRLPAQERARLNALAREKREIERPYKEAEKRARKADRSGRESRAGRARRDRDASYLSWLHEGLPCVACLVLGRPERPGDIEAAHQKLNAADRGVFKRLGVRPDDWLCVPLCRFHHREGPPCCDPAQAKFWRIMGLEPGQVADFCRALYGAFEQEADGSAIVRDFASLAAGQRAAA